MEGFGIEKQMMMIIMMRRRRVKVGGKQQHMCLHLADYVDENDENDCV